MEIQPGNEPYVHHAIMSRCSKEVAPFYGKPEPCWDTNNPEKFSQMKQYCGEMIEGWAVGGKV